VKSRDSAILPTIMARDIEDKKTKKALRKLRKAKSRAEAENGPGLTDWEKDFFEGVEERLETYGSAFSDPEKGNLDEALSARQTHIVREIDKKSRKNKSGMKRSSFKPKKTKTPKYTPRGRDIHEDILEDIDTNTPPEKTSAPKLKIASEQSTLSSSPTQAPNIPRPTPGFKPRVIMGGKTDD